MEPLSVALQPAKTKLALVGAVGAEVIVPPVTNESAVTELPPFELYVTVNDRLVVTFALPDSLLVA
ncbi:unannotated protein [freshwater metagenome]|uniref:Unannotated protein n=1 Tax=freshwater metagenome TaxID=449393 RepID=A0A6J6EHW9_9ZZZZ